MAEVDEDKEFEMEMMQKHHDDMVSTIKSIKFPEQKDNSAIILKLELAVEKLSAKLDVIKQPKITVEKTEINQTEVVSLLKDLIKEIKALKDNEAKEKKKEFSVDVYRNPMGYIQSANIKEV